VLLMVESLENVTIGALLSKWGMWTSYLWWVQKTYMLIFDWYILIFIPRNKLQHHPTKTKLMIIGSTYNLSTIVYDYLVIFNNNAGILKAHSHSMSGGSIWASLER
jgi:hypothetical protein